jgi:hypothetical protein
MSLRSISPSSELVFEIERGVCNMAEENTVTADTCTMAQLVNAVRLVRYLRDQAVDEHEENKDLEHFIGHFIDHGGTKEELDIVLGDMNDDEEDEELDEDEEELEEEDEPGMSLEEFTKLMG